MFLKIGESWVNPAQIAHMRLVEGTVPRLSVVTCDGTAHTERGDAACELFKTLITQSISFLTKATPGLSLTHANGVPDVNVITSSPPAAIVPLVAKPKGKPRR